MIANNYDSFVTLWRLLRQTQETFRTDNRRFCVRRIIQHWHKTGLITPEHLASLPPLRDEGSAPSLASRLMSSGHHRTPLKGEGALGGGLGVSLDNLIWEICLRTNLQGYNDLPPPNLYPRPHREILRQLVAVVLGIGERKVNLHELDRAYSEVFPDSTPINVAKKKR